MMNQRGGAVAICGNKAAFSRLSWRTPLSWPIWSAWTVSSPSALFAARLRA